MSNLPPVPIPAFTNLNRTRVMRLYRRALKLQMSWTPRYDVFRGQALEIRRRFESNKTVSDPRMLQRIIDEAEGELYQNRHPDPYIPPTAPGGSKWERNLPPDRLTPPNIARDFSNFQTWADDQRPYWEIIRTFPSRFIQNVKFLFFPPAEPTWEERQKISRARWRLYQKEQREKVEAILKDLNLPLAEIPARRRAEINIMNSKASMDQWTWDALFAEIEDTGNREALAKACFEHFTEKPRRIRLNLHRGAIKRAEKFKDKLTPVEYRELEGQEIAIAAVLAHGTTSFAQRITAEYDKKEGDPLEVRKQLYEFLVKEKTLPRLERFKKIIAERDDASELEQTRPYWQPKSQLLKQLDKFEALITLKDVPREVEKTDFIWEWYMADRLYPEMDPESEEAMSWRYWAQGAEYCPPDYLSPEERQWKKQAEVIGAIDKDFKQFVDEMAKRSRKARGEYEAVTNGSK